MRHNGEQNGAEHSRCQADRSLPVCVGVTAAGSGIAQTVIDGLRACPLPVRVVGFELSSRAKGLYDCDAAHRLPKANDPDYGERLLSICQQEKVDLLIPGSDPELPEIARVAPLLERTGCRALVSSENCVRTLQDKKALHDAMVEHGVPFFDTRLVGDVMDHPDVVSYPAIVKPRWGSASAGIQIVTCVSDWARIREDLPTGQRDDWIVQPLGKPFAWDEPTWQQVLVRRQIAQQDQLAVQLFVSDSREILGRMAWLVTLKHGVVMSVESIDQPGIWHAVEPLERAACSLGARGPVNAQGIWDGKKARFFEVNPRFSGSTGVRALLGYREVEAAVRHFGLRESAQSIQKLLAPSAERIGVRQMVDRAVPTAWVKCFEDSGRLVSPLPLKKILVTGGSGYLGQQIIRTLLEDGELREIAVPVRDRSGIERAFADHPERARLTPLDWESLEQCCPQASADVLIHAAAVRPPSCEEGLSLFVENLRLTQIAVRAATRLAIPLVIYVSSHAVYEGRIPPWTEHAPPHPQSPYAFAKLACEELVRTLGENGTRYVILRMAGLYGLSERIQWERVAHRFARQAARGEPLEVHGTGAQRIDLLHVKDAAEAVACVLKTTDLGWNRTYNISSGNPVGIMELAELCSKIAADEAGLDVSIQTIGAPASAVCYGSSNQMARDVLGWSPSVSLRAGLEEIMRSIWCRSRGI